MQERVGGEEWRCLKARGTLKSVGIGMKGRVEEWNRGWMAVGIVVGRGDGEKVRYMLKVGRRG